MKLGGLLLALSCLAPLRSGATPNSPAPPAPQSELESQAIEEAYWAYGARDAREAARAMALLPKNHILRPWVQGWIALADPSSDALAMANFARKFPPSTMRWRLLQEAGARLAKSGNLDAALAALGLVPPGALAPVSRCVLALKTVPSREAAIELLSQGSGSELCSKAAGPVLGSDADALSASFLRLKDNAPSVARSLADLGHPLALSALARSEALSRAPQWNPQSPLVSKEALSLNIARSLAQGSCPNDLPAPERLTERGSANAARCALWTQGPQKALPYWRYLAQASPRDARWGALAALAAGTAPASGIRPAPTSYFALASPSALGHRDSLAKGGSSAPAPSCSEISSELALALWAHGARREAIEAWRDEIERSDLPRRACLGLRAGSIGAHPLRIAAFAGSEFDARAYEPGYEPEIRASGAHYDFPIELWLSVARQESRFDAQALSRSGALGLFQLMPGTAKEAAFEAKIPAPSGRGLFDPALNARVAAAHFAKLWRQFDQNPAWALCAYNAGASRCKGWRSKLSGLPTVFQIEAMPYDETRVYVERVLAGWSLTPPYAWAGAAYLAQGLRQSAPRSRPVAPKLRARGAQANAR